MSVATETAAPAKAAEKAAVKAAVKAPVKAPVKADAKGGVVAYLQLDGAIRAVDFYRRALSAELAALMPPDEQGRTMHAHLYINGSSVMLSDFFPEHCHAVEKPQGFVMTLIVDDIDGWWQRAVDAGAEAMMPPAEMFWGDRYGQFRDPFGVLWALNQPQAR